MVRQSAYHLWPHLATHHKPLSLWIFHLPFVTQTFPSNPLTTLHPQLIYWWKSIIELIHGIYSAIKAVWLGCVRNHNYVIYAEHHESCREGYSHINHALFIYLFTTLRWMLAYSINMVAVQWLNTLSVKGHILVQKI